MMLASGQLKDFRAGYGEVVTEADGSVAVSRRAAELLDLEQGGGFVAVGR